ncbi:hypothetical protein INH39_28490 [Massilia violaceinigra]|uniref:Uncharacterized protein n=1 Tax=Massilia violaceinigra TaxID=2045208 RepID=A0ABY4A6Z1_9BURK|nr:hypothetical protein [Massilia violaceinigra]UOD29306.1 hypothetical protein INH39_28490 [Massilia violaceinigra]
MDQEPHLGNLRNTFQRACELIAHGNYEAALRELLWINDNPIPDFLPSEMFRRACGFQAWEQLAYLYPPAKKKMEEVLAKNIEAAKNGTAGTSIQADIRRMQGILASELLTSSE